MPFYKPGTPNPRKKNTIILLYGPESSFKTSTALTANALLFDFNETGSSRAHEITEKNRFIPENWAEFYYNLSNKLFDDYSTFIIDTTSDMLIKFIAPFLFTENPAFRDASGNGLSKDGWAALSNKFHEDFMSNLHDKTLIFIAHDNPSAEGDVIKHSPNISGSIGNSIMSVADQIGYFEKKANGGVTIRFSNSNAWRSKDTAKVGDIDIPALESKEWPTFFQDQIINPLAEKLSFSKEIEKIREKTITTFKTKLAEAKTPEDLDAILMESNKIGDNATQIMVKNNINLKSKELKFTYDSKTSKFSIQNNTIK